MMPRVINTSFLVVLYALSTCCNNLPCKSFVIRSPSVSRRASPSLLRCGVSDENEATTATDSSKVRGTFQEEQSSSSSTMDSTIDEKLLNLSSKAGLFSDLSLRERLEIVKEIEERMRSKRWITAGDWLKHEAALLKLSPPPGDSKIRYSYDAKAYMGIARYSMSSSVMAFLKTLRESLEYRIAKKEGGKAVVPKLLASTREEVVARGQKRNVHGPIGMPFIFHRFEVWTSPTAASESLVTNGEDIEAGTQADTSGGVSLVLGAGNQSYLSMIDVLQCMFVHPCKPVLLKHHQIRPFLLGVYAEIFEPLTKRGFLDQILDGGIPQTRSILAREEVQHVHLTGALATANAIKETLKASRPRSSPEEVDRMLTSELGCATPCIVSRGEYTNEELNNAAINIVSGKKFFSGCNCLSTQVVVLPENWPQKQQFRSILLEQLRKTTTDPSYYPGSESKLRSFIEKYDDKKVTRVESAIGGGKRRRNHNNNEDRIGLVGGSDNDDDSHYSHRIDPHLFECGVVGTDAFNDHALKTEAFGPVLAIAELPDGDSVSDMDYLLNKAVPFVNDKNNIFGSLSCALIYPGKHQPDDLATIKKAIGALKYGTVCVNTFTGFGYIAIGYGGRWGGHKDEERHQSGKGCVGNGSLIPNVDKTVVYARSLRFPILVQRRRLLPGFVFDLLADISLGRSFVSRGILNAFSRHF